MDNYTIRNATISDVPALVTFGQQVSHDTYVRTGFLPADYVAGPQRYFWRAEYLLKVCQTDTALLLVVFDDDTLIGMAEVAQLSEREAVMWKCYVQRAYHGRGLGKRLLQEIIGRLPHTIEHLKTEYYESNSPAAGFYKAQGFTFLERKEEQFAGTIIPYIYVSKTLNSKEINHAI